MKKNFSITGGKKMTNFVPLKKQSKRAQKEYYAAQRGSWNGLDPVSRCVPGKKEYNRKKQKQADRRSFRERESACFLSVCR